MDNRMASKRPGENRKGARSMWPVGRESGGVAVRKASVGVEGKKRKKRAPRFLVRISLGEKRKARVSKTTRLGSKAAFPLRACEK